MDKNYQQLPSQIRFAWQLKQIVEVSNLLLNSITLPYAKNHLQTYG